jgi:hypothetical protein
MLRGISRVILFCGLLALAAEAAGCQRGLTWNRVPAEGTLTKDGRPLRGIQVVFLADADAGTQGPRAIGITDEAGHYRLRTDNGDEGAVVGKYRVLVLDVGAANKQRFHCFSEPQRKEATRLPPENAKRFAEQLKSAAEVSRVPPRYRHFHETPLHAEVGGEPLTFDIVIP